MYSGSEDGSVKIWDLRAPGCQREYESCGVVNTVVLHQNQTELVSGDQDGNIHVWDLTANSCSCELVPEVDTAVRSLTVMWDGSLVVAANNHGTSYVWLQLRGTQTMTNFEPLHKLQAHNGYILQCLLSPAEMCEPRRYLATASSHYAVVVQGEMDQMLGGLKRDLPLYLAIFRSTNGTCLLRISGVIND